MEFKEGDIVVIHHVNPVLDKAIGVVDKVRGESDFQPSYPNQVFRGFHVKSFSEKYRKIDDYYGWYYRAELSHYRIKASKIARKLYTGKVLKEEDGYLYLTL